MTFRLKGAIFGSQPAPDPLRDLLGTDLAWVTDQAVCAQTDSDPWFPEKGSEAHFAKKLCRSCPLLTPCLAYALARPETQGIWGATSETERKRLRRERGIPAAAERRIAAQQQKAHYEEARAILASHACGGAA